METAAVDDCVRLVFGAFPSSRPGAETLKLWRDELEELGAPAPIALQACRRLVFERRDKGTPPALPDVVAAILRQVDESERKGRPAEEDPRPATREEARAIVEKNKLPMTRSTRGRFDLPAGGHWTVEDMLSLWRWRQGQRIPGLKHAWTDEQRVRYEAKVLEMDAEIRRGRRAA